MTNFYLTDRKFNLISIIATTNDTPIYFEDVQDVQSIEEAARSFTGTITIDENKRTIENWNKADEMSKVGNYILYKDIQNQSVFITIESQEIDPVGCTIDIAGHDAGIDLINEVVAEDKPDKAYTIAEYINKYTWDSGWEIGRNEASNLSRKLTGWESDGTALSRILSVAKGFDVELDFSFDVSGLDVVHRYINIYRKRGTDDNVTLYVNKEIEKIITTTDIYDLCTSIKAIGGEDEKTKKNVTLKGYKWTDPDGRFTLNADGILRDTQSVKLWSRLLSNENPNPLHHHIQRYVKYESKSQAQILKSALSDLKKRCEPAVNYKVEIVHFPALVKIGDTIKLVDEQRTLYLSARVLELKYDYTIENAEATLGDYLIQEGRISSDLQDLANTLKDKVANMQKDVDLKAEYLAQATAPEKTINVIWIDTSNSEGTGVDIPRIYDPETENWVKIVPTQPIEVNAFPNAEGTALAKALEDARKESERIAKEVKEVTDEANIRYEEVDGLRTDVNTVQHIVDEQSGSITSLVTKVNDNGQDITQLKQDSAGFKTTVANLQDDLEGTTGKITQLEQDSDSFKTTVQETYATKDNLDAQTKKVTSLSQDLSGFKTTVASTYATQTELSGVDTVVQDQTKKLSQLSQTVDGFKQTVSSTYATKTSLKTTDDKAVAATNLANSKGKVIYTSADANKPENQNGNVLYISEVDGNKPKRWNGSEWVIVTDQTAINAAKAASDARTVANNAFNGQKTANENIDTLTKDNNISPIEKQSLAKEIDTINSNYAIDKAQADKYNLNSTNYTTAMASLTTYMSSILSNMTSTTSVNRAELKKKFSDYYTARTDLLNRIANVTDDKITSLTPSTRNLLLNSQTLLSEDSTSPITGANVYGWNSGGNLLLGTSSEITTRTNDISWDNYIYDSVQVEPNKTYTLSAWIENITGTPARDIRINLYNAAGTRILDAVANYKLAGFSGYVTQTFTTPSDAVTARVNIKKNDGTTSSGISYKEVKLELGSTATPYVNELSGRNYVKDSSKEVSISGGGAGSNKYSSWNLVTKFSDLPSTTLYVSYDLKVTSGNAAGATVLFETNNPWYRFTEVFTIPDNANRRVYSTQTHGSLATFDKTSFQAKVSDLPSDATISITNLKVEVGKITPYSPAPEDFSPYQNPISLSPQIEGTRNFLRVQREIKEEFDNEYYIANEYKESFFSMSAVNLTLTPNTKYLVTTSAPDRGTSYDVFVDNVGAQPSSGTNGISITKPKIFTTDSTGKIQVSQRVWSDLNDTDISVTQVFENGWIPEGVGENLIANSTATATIVGNNEDNQTDTTFHLTKPFSEIKPTSLVMSFDLEVTGSGNSGRLYYQTLSPWNNLLGGMVINLPDYLGKKVRIICEPTTVSSTLTNPNISIQSRMNYVPTTMTVKVSNMKIEVGSTATPYYPNSTEYALDHTQMALANSIPVANLTDSIVNKGSIAVHFKARASQEVDFSMMQWAKYNDGGYEYLQTESIHVTRDWQQFTLYYPNLGKSVDLLRFNPHQLLTQGVRLNDFYLDLCEWYVGAGNKATPWVAASEDAFNQIEDAKDSLNNNINNVREELTSSIEQTSSEILSTVSESYVTSSDYGDFVEQTSTALKQTSEDFTFSFNDLTGQLNDLDGNTSEQFKLIKKYIQFIDGRIDIGQSDSTTKLSITNDKISMIQGGSEVMYITNQLLYIDKGVFVSSLQVSEHIWTQLSPDQPDILSLEWMG